MVQSSDLKIEDQWKVEDKDQMEKIIGICDLLFEVTYGAAEGLHSIAVETLKELLQYCFSDKTNSD